MKRNLAALILLLTFGLLRSISAREAQDSTIIKNFKQFKEIIKGIDFFASSRGDIEPFERRLANARQKIAYFLGEDLARGAIVICSSMTQKDSVNETRVLKMGYRWVLVQLTPEAASEQMLSSIKAQMGGQVPPQLLQMVQNQSSEIKAMGISRLADATVQKFGSAVIMTTLAPEKEFRTSRLDDAGWTQLEDWLDISLAAHAAGNAKTNLTFLKEHLDEAFPLEDVLGGMARPFVPPSVGGGMAGSPVIRAFGGPPGSAGGAPASAVPAPPSTGGHAPGQHTMTASMSMPKDVQDRMTFDQQAGTLFEYLIEKLGNERVRALVQWNRQGKKSREFLTQEGMLGPDLEKIEKDWQEWVKSQKTEQNLIRIQSPSGPVIKPPQP